MKKINIGALTMALAEAGLFLWVVLNPPSVFNMLPFAIHEAVNPEGISEGTFIIIFDLIASLFILIVGYRILNKILKR